jgi:hypothetical protein
MPRVSPGENCAGAKKRPLLGAVADRGLTGRFPQCLTSVNKRIADRVNGSEPVIPTAPVFNANSILSPIMVPAGRPFGIVWAFLQLMNRMANCQIGQNPFGPKMM